MFPGYRLYIRAKVTQTKSDWAAYRQARNDLRNDSNPFSCKQPGHLSTIRYVPISQSWQTVSSMEADGTTTTLSCSQVTN